ncbi:hypothetical protein [Shewanella sp.]|uniref:hypothetical protein n=1 Tax=Shewanella sp. TaxID=50422 RepID=UPI003A83B312
MIGKKFFAVTIVLYLSSLFSYYSQIKIIDFYGIQVKFYFDLYLSYLQIAITLTIFGLPNAISLLVSREGKIPKNINSFSLICAAIVSTLLNVIFLNGDFGIQAIIFLFLYISLFNDLNTGVMSSIGMFEFPRYYQFVGNILVLLLVYLNPFEIIFTNKLSEHWYALVFIITPILPLFIALRFSKKFKINSEKHEHVNLQHVFKYVNFIYLFSILSIVMNRVPYINFSNYIDKYSLAQYTLSISLSNFIVIPLNLITLKILSSKTEQKFNMLFINLLLISLTLISSFVLYYISSNFELLKNITNISSSSILVSTYLVVVLIAVSSINLSVSLRFQKKVKAFLILDAILVTITFLLTYNASHSFEDLSKYNYIIAIFIVIKILFQSCLLRDKNVFNHHCKL